MKKINTFKMLCLCALGCICATNAMAQSTGSGFYRIAGERAADLEVGKDYVIYNTAMNGTQDRTGFIYANSGNGLGLAKKAPADKEIMTAEYVWTVEQSTTDGKYYLKSKSKDSYVNSDGNTANEAGQDLYIVKWHESETLEMEAGDFAHKAGVGSKNDDGTTTTNATIGADNRVWLIGRGGIASTATDKRWWNGNETAWNGWASAHPYAFYAVEELGESDLVQVTYTYYQDGQRLGEKQVTEYAGYAPTEPGNVPSYITATGFPATIEAGTTAYTIETTYNATLPFTISTDEAPVYYRVKFSQDGGYYWYANANNEGKEEFSTCNGLTLATEQNWKWKFVGDWFNGFNIMTQSGKYLTIGNITTGTGSGGTRLANTSLTDAPESDKSYFLLQNFTTNTGEANQWRFNLKNDNMSLAHTSSSSLNITAYYEGNRPNYLGGKLVFEEMGDFRTMLDELYATKDEAKGFLEMTHVGTPVADATERTELQATVTQIDNLNDNTISYQTYKPLPEALTTQLTAYLACTNLLMPESGKAYTIVIRPLDMANGIYRHLDFTGSGLRTVAMENKDSEIPESGVFVFRSWQVGETTKYAIVPAYGSVYGKYLNHQGISDAWTDNVNECAVQTLLAGNKGYIADQSAANLFGYVAFRFNKRTDKNTNGVFVINCGNGSIDKADQPFLKVNNNNNSYSSALIVKEVENYPSSVKLNAVDNIEGITAIGTFSAPYAAIVPEGVTAHYVSSADNKAQATAIAEGEAIPAGQGVLLTGEAGTAVMQPATTETQAAIEGNLLGNTAGGAKALEHGKDYILTGGNQGVAFYPISATDLTVSANKAYLHTEGANAPALVLSFGEGETDGVKGIDGTEGKQAPVFDLQGRRVQKAVKGLYIQNGKKFMVK